MGYFQPSKGDEDAPHVDQDSGDGDEGNHGKEIEQSRGGAEGDRAQGLPRGALAPGGAGKQVAGQAKEEPLADEAERRGREGKEAKPDAVVTCISKEERPEGPQRTFSFEQGFVSERALAQAREDHIEERLGVGKRDGQEEAADKLGGRDQDTDRRAQKESLDPGVVIVDHFYEWVGL